MLRDESIKEVLAGMSEDQVVFTTLVRIVRACEESGLDLSDQLAVLALAWIERAQEERRAAAATPGGAEAAQRCQLTQLRKIAALIGDVDSA